jgi:uncharacterized protein YfdQ (DUF2303 family)
MFDINEFVGQLAQPEIIDADYLGDHVGDLKILVTPPGWRTNQLTELLPAPLKIQSEIVVNDVESFSSYLADFVDQGTPPRVFADEATKSIVAILDAHQKNKPSHQYHRVTLLMHESPEWEIWKKFCGEYVNKSVFTRFIENNMEQIIGEFSGVKLLEMCRDIRATSGSSAEFKEDLESGQRQLAVSNESGVTAGKSRIAFPELINVQLRVFKGDIEFDFQARLRWDYTDGQLTFAIDLKDYRIVEELCFLKIAEQVATKTELHVLTGKPG